ncbi:MAG: rod shape-determining protein MreC [bacterium]
MLELLKRNRLLAAATGVLLVLVVVLSIRARNPDGVRVIDETISAVTYPVQAVAAGISRGTSRLVRRYVFLARVEEENQALKLRVAALEEELNHYINGSIQFNLLREQLRFNENDPKRKVYAEVIGESADNFHHTLLINKGRRDGIRRNFAVLLREGVVGRIQNATTFQAVVQLIVDRRHRFPVILQRSRERTILEGGGGTLRLMAPDRGIVFGLGEGLRMNRIRMLADVREGDRVITSGLAGIFPKGHLVGIITGVARERHELFQTASIQPVVDFNKLEGVYVIIDPDGIAKFPYFSEE